MIDITALRPSWLRHVPLDDETVSNIFWHRRLPGARTDGGWCSAELLAGGAPAFLVEKSEAPSDASDGRMLCDRHQAKKRVVHKIPAALVSIFQICLCPMPETECVSFFLDSVVPSLLSLSSSRHRGLTLAVLAVHDVLRLPRRPPSPWSSSTTFHC